MSELTGLQPAALLALRFSQHFEGTRRGENGYIHSVVLHPDGMAEDAWGKASLDEIAGRFGAIEFAVSCEEHRAVVEKLIRTSGERFSGAVREAKELISLHRQTLAAEGATPVSAAPA